MIKNGKMCHNNTLKLKAKYYIFGHVNLCFASIWIMYKRKLENTDWEYCVVLYNLHLNII